MGEREHQSHHDAQGDPGQRKQDAVSHSLLAIPDPKGDSGVAQAEGDQGWFRATTPGGQTGEQQGHRGQHPGDAEEKVLRSPLGTLWLGHGVPDSAVTPATRRYRLTT